MVALGPTFCRSLLAKEGVIGNTKIRVCLCVYSDSDDSNIMSPKYLGYCLGCEVTCKLCFVLEN
jgi:hypothetical protein